eukprot:TRINITY_DN2333_c0_g2_i1.p1 TRINITY_DN2333_c0_g2~~TRINITY_DN2333_c0_g2_i1.p1  ORF type:complete len:495 (-),score=137.86 TRINITY_DN2333_c0_g2_i1:61-1545(-)
MFAVRSLGFTKAIGKRFASQAVTRNPNFAQVNDADVAFFTSVLGEKGVLTEAHDIEPYNADWLNKFVGQTKLVLKPTNTKEVSEILKYCNERKLAVCPQGGNTGLVGGSVPVFDEIVLNLSKMNKIKDFNATSGVVIAETGVILQNLDEFLKEHGHCAPLDLGAKGSCHVGGNTSTNAGGIRLLRYGSLHGNVLGVEAVMADGTILDGLCALRKDNTGFDLKQLFIGSEGTLGVVTAVAWLCPPLSSSVNVALLGTSSYELAQKILLKAKSELGEILSAFEFFDSHCMDLLLEDHKTKKNPLEDDCKFYVLIETSGSNETHDKEKLNNFLESTLDQGLVSTGTVAESETQQKDIWWFRETITESLRSKGKPYKYDISLPVPAMYDLVEKMKQRFSEMPEVFVCGYGHMGDGNLHLNIVAPEFSDKVLNTIEPYVYEFTAEHRGSISAEHGIGLMKTKSLHFSKSEPMIQLMRDIKKVMDPNGILNPYKVLPEKE